MSHQALVPSTRPRRRLFLGAAVAVSLLAGTLFSSVAFGSSVVARSVAELTAYSDLVVDGEVTAVDSYWDAEGRIWTRAIISVRTPLKGSAGEEVVIRQLGGERDGMHMRVEGALALEPGQRMVLFAQSFAGGYTPTLLSYSAFLIEGEAAEAPVRHAAAELSLFREGPSGLVHVEADELRFPTNLKQLSAQVRAAAGRTR